MKKQITITTLGIFMISLALAMYAGESTTFETNLTNPLYTVVDNTSSLEGLTVEFENGNITVYSDPLMESDNFTLLFFDEVTREVVKRVGGSHTEYIDRNVTVYVPKYIDKIVNKCDNDMTNDTCIVPVEVINDDIILEEKSSYKKLIAIALIAFVGLIVIVSLISIKLRKNKD